MAIGAWVLWGLSELSYLLGAGHATAFAIMSSTRIGRCINAPRAAV
jgi:hypothetical protein